MNKRKMKKAYLVEITDQELDQLIEAESTLYTLFKQAENKSKTSRRIAYDKWWNIWNVVEQITQQKDAKENTNYSNFTFIEELKSACPNIKIRTMK